MDPILLQKQIRDNSEDLNKYLSDLKIWEEDMKRKEKELYGDKGQDQDEILPPVRSKIKRVSQPNTPVNENPPKIEVKSVEDQKQRIPSHDYSAWEKFDVEKACEEVEQITVSSDISKETEKQKNIEEAMYEKENGNKLVRLGKWKEAMECYTRAISHDSNNAIFYANRAQCALKLLKWQQVIDDCCKALTIEPGYVKAYLRRSTARMKLEEYQGAVEDLNKALTLEPGNKEARCSLAEAKSQLQKAKVLAKSDNAMIVAISKPLHLRSKVPLKRIPIEEVGESAEEEFEDSQENFDSPILPTIPTAATDKPVQDKPAQSKSSPTLESKKKPASVTKVEPSFVDKLPLPPKTSVQFMFAWSQLKPELHYSYLEQIPGSELPDLFGNSLESNVLSEVLAALSTASPTSQVYNYLEGISRARRFSALTLFMTTPDKSRVQDLLNICVSNGQCTEADANKLAQKYEV